MTVFPRLYPILDIGLLARVRMPLVEAAHVFIDGGVEILQWRCKKQVGTPELDELERLAELCRRASVPLIVNDRADLAAMTGAAGVHVGQDDLTPDAVRRVTGSRMITGFSTHNYRQFIEAQSHSLDYVAIGPIFGTTTKENPDPPVDLDTLSRCARETPLPVVAIGGITRDKARKVLAAGASSVAVISDLFPQPCDPDSLRARLAEWMTLLRG